MKFTVHALIFPSLILNKNQTGHKHIVNNAFSRDGHDMLSYIFIAILLLVANKIHDWNWFLMVFISFLEFRRDATLSMKKVDLPICNPCLVYLVEYNEHLLLALNRKLFVKLNLIYGVKGTRFHCQLIIGFPRILASCYAESILCHVETKYKIGWMECMAEVIALNKCI